MKKTITWVIVIIVIIAAGYYLLKNKSDVAPATPNTPTDNSSAGTEGTGPAVSVLTIKYADSGFSPANLTVKKGDTVTFINQSRGAMWVSSGPHPSHTAYSGTDKSSHCPDTADVAFDQCETGGTFTFTFNKVGEWGYHNHVATEDKGVVIVK